MGEGIWYITTPIYYPSDNLHIGHAYTTVAADALARYHRLLGEPVRFVTGTDEHGQKIQKRALEAGTTPKAFVDRIVAFIQDPLWKSLGISYDEFIRTTDPRHHRVVQEIFQKLYAKGDIYKGTYEGWYCLPDETFWTESKLVDGKCPDCGRPVERVHQESYFFRMSRYQDAMRRHILDHPEFIQPVSRRNEMLGFLEGGLEDLSISRTGMKWGIPVPDDPRHVIYVWFDALSNYLTAAGYGDNPELFARAWPANLHLVGKEIVRFHTIIWPIMLMALELPLPEKVFGHGWLLIGDTKMSKSRGNAVDPLVLIDRYGVDAVRYYLLREVPFGADGSYTEEALVLRTNVDLANDLGNLLHRSVAMVERFGGGRIPLQSEIQEELELRQPALTALGEVRQAMDALNISGALAAVNQLVGRANKYIDQAKPWALSKAGQTDALARVFYDLGETLRVISVLLSPFLLETPDRLRRRLGLDAPVLSLSEAEFGFWEGGTRVRPGEPLFPRIETEAAHLRAQSDQKAPKAEPAPPRAPDADASMIEISDFQKLDLRVAKIVAAEPVQGADRLLQLTVFDGQRERTVVSGIREYYQASELVGQQVVLVANLKPVKLRGILSEGMLLAASSEEDLAVVAPHKPLKEGSRVK